ncbi:MAG: hypothetical protein KDJ90_19620 [Nitratireductor sp.]|nr:hypothetical protein [Nitratireductor sp.]
MPNEKSPARADFPSLAESIEQLLEAEQAVESRLDEAKKAASRKVADAYGEAQAIDRKMSEKVARLARDCAAENDKRVAEILARAEEVSRKPVTTQGTEDAVRAAAVELAARLTGGEG